MFEETKLPSFMTIPWDLAQIGQSIYFSWNEIINEKNVHYVINSAKAVGLIVHPEYIADGVRFHVMKIKETKKRGQDLISKIIEILQQNPQGLTVTELYKGFGLPGSRANLIDALQYLARKEIIEGKRHANKSAGRPTTLYKLK